KETLWLNTFTAKASSLWFIIPNPYTCTRLISILDTAPERSRLRSGSAMRSFHSLCFRKLPTNRSRLSQTTSGHSSAPGHDHFDLGWAEVANVRAVKFSGEGSNERSRQCDSSMLLQSKKQNESRVTWRSRPRGLQ